MSNDGTCLLEQTYLQIHIHRDTRVTISRSLRTAYLLAHANRNRVPALSVPINCWKTCQPAIQAGNVDLAQNYTSHILGPWAMGDYSEDMICLQE